MVHRQEVKGDDRSFARMADGKASGTLGTSRNSPNRTNCLRKGVARYQRKYY